MTNEQGNALHFSLSVGGGTVMFSHQLRHHYDQNSGRPLLIVRQGQGGEPLGLGVAELVLDRHGIDVLVSALVNLRAHWPDE